MRATATVDSRSPETEGIYEEQNQGKNHGFPGITFYFLPLLLSLIECFCVRVESDEIRHAKEIF